MKKILVTTFLLATTLAVSTAQVQWSVGQNSNGQVGASIQLGSAANNASINGGVINNPSQAVGGNLLSVLAFIQTIVNRLVPIAIGIGVLALFYGIIMLIFDKDAADHKKWATFIMWSLIGLFVMVSIWGLVGFLGSIFGIGQGGGIPVPAIPTGPTNG